MSVSVLFTFAGELAQLLQGAQVDQGFDMVDEEDDDEDEMKIFKTFNPRQYKFNSEVRTPNPLESSRANAVPGQAKNGTKHEQDDGNV